MAAFARSPRARSVLRIAGLLALFGLPSLEAHAACDNIPLALDEWRGAEGTVTSPIAQPGQGLQIRVRPQICDEGSAGLNVSPEDPASACRAPEDVRVSLLFTPNAGGPVNAAVLATDCSAAQPAVNAWATALAPGGGTATCFDESHPTDAPSIAISRLELGADTAECRLSFRYPAFHGAGAPSPENVLTGPAKIVVQPAGAPLPTSLATSSCAASLSSLSSIACIDEFFANDGTCLTGDQSRHPRFASFTALPPANDFAAMCTPEPGDTSSPCLGLQPDVRIAIDAAGNVLAPIDWSGVLFTGESDDFPPPQLVSLVSNVGSGLPTPPGASVAIPEREFLSSHTVSGKELPPLFDPLADTTQALSLFGSADAPRTVIRIQARSGMECRDVAGARTGVPCVSDLACGDGGSCGGSVCADAPGIACTSDAQCPGSCGPAVFDLAYLETPPGATILPSGSYAATTDGFVPLSALHLCRADGSGLACLFRDEVLAGKTQNADADALDPSVITARDRRTGAQLALGLDGADGVATTLLQEATPSVGPFASPPRGPNVRPAAVGVGSCLALLAAEPWENAPDPEGTDATGDGHVFDSDLRVFCQQADGSLAEVAQTAGGVDFPLAASAQPILLRSPLTRSPLQGGGEPLLLEEDGALVYFLLDERAVTPKADLRIDLGVGGETADAPAGAPVLSDDGMTVCFESDANNLVASRDKNHGGPDVYCADVETGFIEVVNRYQEPPSKRPLCEGRIIRANDTAFAPDTDATGNRVCYESGATNLVRDDRNKNTDVFVLDRETCAMTRVSVDASGAEVKKPSSGCALSGSGAWVAFLSDGSLVAGDGDNRRDAYLRHVDAGTLLLASAGLEGTARAIALAREGRLLAIEMDGPAGAEVVLLEGAPGAWSERERFAGSAPVLDRAGTQLAFESGGETVLADLENGFLMPVAQTAELIDVMAPSHDATLAAERVAFVSPEHLTPVEDGGDDAYVRDRVTRFLRRVGDGASAPSLAADGASLAYVAQTATGAGVFRSGDDFLAVPGDFDGDGVTGERVLAALDLSGAPTLQVIGSVAQVSVAGRTVVLLTNETPAHAIAHRLACPDGSCAPFEVDLGPASAVATSEDLTCVLRGANDRLACAPVGEPLVDVAGFGGGPVSAAALAVSGTVAVASQVDAAGVQRLLVLQRVGSNLVPRYLGAGGNRRFVVSDNGFVAADRCEADVGQDLNGDGFEDECVLDLVNGRTGAVEKTGTTLIPCTSDACDRRWPWRIFSSGETSQNATARVLTWECQECGSCGPTPRTPEACCDLDQNGSCEDVIIQEVTFDERRYVLSALSENATSDPLAGPQSGQGGFDQGAVLPALIGRCESDPSVACQTAANCPGADDACIDRVPAVQAYSDSDGDGIFDGFDNCQFDFNPDQTNGDGDPAGDGCDLLNCGDGVVEPLEYCDEGAANGTAGSFCTAICTPVVNVSVSESAVNPGQAGGVPGAILGNLYLNLATAPAGDRPAKMIDPGSIHFEGVRSSERCAKAGPGLTKHDLTDAQRYIAHLGNSNGDALPDLSLHIDVPSSQVAIGDTELCVTGAFRNVPGRFRPARFETRVPLNVR